MDKVKPHPKEYDGYHFLSVVSTKKKMSKVQDQVYVGVVYNHGSSPSSPLSEISFLNLTDVTVDILEDINMWDEAMPLNIYLAIKGYCLDGIIHSILNTNIREIVGPVYTIPKIRYKRKTRNVKKQRVLNLRRLEEQKNV